MLRNLKWVWYTSNHEVIIVRDGICPVAEAAKLLGDKWTLILLRDLAHGSCRFKSFLGQPGDGISPSILTGRLRDLEEKGIISRTSYNEIPPRVEYALTEKGRDVLPVIEALRVYGQRWCTSDESVSSGHHRHNLTSSRQ
jgi:DNA-binding HxlR family transcriptional regulator